MELIERKDDTMSKKRKCLMCETVYEYCPYCWEYERQPRWRTLFDRSECQNVYHIISDWLGKRITQKEAREKLLMMDIDNIPFNPSVQGNINKIMQTSDEELKAVHDEIADCDDVMDGIKNIEPVLKNDKVFDKADEKKKQVVKIKPVSTVKPVVDKTTNK
mgnify:FL=1